MKITNVRLRIGGWPWEPFPDIDCPEGAIHVDAILKASAWEARPGVPFTLEWQEGDDPLGRFQFTATQEALGRAQGSGASPKPRNTASVRETRSQEAQP